MLVGVGSSVQEVVQSKICDGSMKLSVTSKVFRVFAFTQLSDWGNQSIEETRRTTVDTCHVSTYILKYDVARPRTIKSK